MIRQSETINKLAEAFVAAQAEMTNAPKDARGQVGNQVRFYSDLPTITDLVRPILRRHGLAFMQLPSGGGDGTVSVTTRLLHTSGEWVEDHYSMPAGQGAQGVGSAITYAKRYALMALLGIAADDDDGAAATPTKPKRSQGTTAANQSQPAGKVSAAQLTKLGASFTDNKITDRDARLAFVAAVVGHEVESSKDLTTREAGDVIDALETRRQRLA